MSLASAAAFAVDFGAMLKKKIDDTKRPEAKPAGTYTGVINSFKFGESAKKKTPYLQLIVNNIQPGADVDSSQLDAYRENFPGVLEKWQVTYEFYLTDDALFMLKEFLTSMGINTSGRSYDETIPELRNLPVQLNVTAEPFETPEGEMRMRNNVKSISGLKEAA